MKKVLMLLSLVCIMSCSEDEFSENYQQNEIRNKYHHYYGSANFLFNKSTSHPKLAQFLQENSVSLAMQKSGDTSTDIAINTDRVRVMSNDDVISYTFEVIEESENFEVRNLVIYHEIDNEEELYAYLFDYNLDENGSFELYDASEFENTSFADCDDGNTELIMTLVVDCFPVNCMAGGNHEPGDTSCVAYGGSLGANIHCNIYHVAECTPGQGNTGGSSTGGSWDSGDGEGSDYTGGAGGGNFGDGSSTSGGGVLTQPLGTKAQLSSILDLTRADLMSLDAEQADALLSFLYRNLDDFDVAQDAINFALEMLEIMEENPPTNTNFTTFDYPGVEDGFPFEWWKDDGLINNNIDFNLDQENPYNGLTKQEKLLVKLYPELAYFMSINKDKATEETVDRFSFNGRNDKSDAFRHAFFNALNTRSATYTVIGDGSRVVRKFGEAHESEVPPILILEVEMDLFNNDIGIEYCYDCYPLTTSDEEISDGIWSLLNQGALRYLSPLDHPLSPPNYGINELTELIPTNQ